MKYLGNFSNWVQDEWVDYLLNNDGHPRPNINHNTPEIQKFVNSGYDLNHVFWYKYDLDNFPFEIQPPFSIPNINDSDWWTDEWWIIKQKPGQLMPMHVDPTPRNNTKRFWIPLQDYQPGHIIMVGNKVYTDYQKGDMFMYTDPLVYHGSCNIGHSTRLIISFSTYGEVSENVPLY